MVVRRFVVLVLLSVFCTSAIAQQLTYRPVFSSESTFQQDSIDARSILYYNAYAYKKAKYGLLLGAAGVGLGAGLIWLKTRNESTCDLGCAIAYIVVPLTGGVLGFSVGTLYATAKFRSEDGKRIHTRRRSVVFKKFGITYDFNGEASYWGAVYRRLPSAFYQPTTFKIYFFRTEKSYDYESETSVDNYWPVTSTFGTVNGAGVQVMWVNYYRVLGWALGFDLGWAMGNNLKQWINNTEVYRDVSTFNAYVNFGSNLNVFTSFGITAMYRYRLHGVEDALKPGGYKALDNRYSFALGVVYYFR